MVILKLVPPFVRLNCRPKNIFFSLLSSFSKSLLVLLNFSSGDRNVSLNFAHSFEKSISEPKDISFALLSSCPELLSHLLFFFSGDRHGVFEFCPYIDPSHFDSTVSSVVLTPISVFILAFECIANIGATFVMTAIESTFLPIRRHCSPYSPYSCYCSHCLPVDQRSARMRRPSLAGANRR